jgi:hypothetical protein
MSLSDPLLPAELVKRIKPDDMMSDFVSDVFSQQYHKNRLLMRNWEFPHHPDTFGIQVLEIGFVADMKRNTLHFAAHKGDLLAVYELLRVGATADKADRFRHYSHLPRSFSTWDSRFASCLRHDDCSGRAKGGVAPKMRHPYSD